MFKTTLLSELVFLITNQKSLQILYKNGSEVAPYQLLPSPHSFLLPLNFCKTYDINSQHLSLFVLFCSQTSLRKTQDCKLFYSFAYVNVLLLGPKIILIFCYFFPYHQFLKQISKHLLFS